MPRASKWEGVSLQATRGPFAADVDQASRAAKINLSVAPTFTRSFVTGSRAYGLPRPDSDLDLVVLVDQRDLDLLQTMTKDIGTNDNYDPAELRVGNGIEVY